MSHTHGLTKEDIFAAASEIFASGKNPTQAAVRAKLGRGSFSTITKYLNEWRSQQTEAEAIASDVENIPDSISALLRRFYGVVRANVESSVIGEQIELLESENEALRKQLDEHEAAKAELTGLKFAYQEALARLDQLTRENERLQQEMIKTTTRKPRTRKQSAPATNG